MNRWKEEAEKYVDENDYSGSWSKDVRDAYQAGAQAGYQDGLEERAAEVNRLTYELDKSRDSHMRQIAKLESDIRALKDGAE